MHTKQSFRVSFKLQQVCVIYEGKICLNRSSQETSCAAVMAFLSIVCSFSCQILKKPNKQKFSSLSNPNKKNKVMLASSAVSMQMTLKEDIIYIPFILKRHHTLQFQQEKALKPLASFCSLTQNKIVFNQHKKNSKPRLTKCFDTSPPCKYLKLASRVCLQAAEQLPLGTHSNCFIYMNKKSSPEFKADIFLLRNTFTRKTAMPLDSSLRRKTRKQIRTQILSSSS